MKRVVIQLEMVIDDQANDWEWSQINWNDLFDLAHNENVESIKILKEMDEPEDG